MKGATLIPRSSQQNCHSNLKVSNWVTLIFKRKTQTNIRPQKMSMNTTKISRKVRNQCACTGIGIAAHETPVLKNQLDDRSLCNFSKHLHKNYLHFVSNVRRSQLLLNFRWSLKNKREVRVNWQSNNFWDCSWFQRCWKQWPFLSQTEKKESRLSDKTFGDKSGEKKFWGNDTSMHWSRGY